MKTIRIQIGRNICDFRNMQGNLENDLEKLPILSQICDFKSSRSPGSSSSSDTRHLLSACKNYEIEFLQKEKKTLND